MYNQNRPIVPHILMANRNKWHWGRYALYGVPFLVSLFFYRIEKYILINVRNGVNITKIWKEDQEKNKKAKNMALMAAILKNGRHFEKLRG